MRPAVQQAFDIRQGVQRVDPDLLRIRGAIQPQQFAPSHRHGQHGQLRLHDE
eukprot:CAMPEP_0172537724 /NCGR_PEP_ID=MMETSP1067-20121228/9278_1 /TAXON_ID=265564 ORGANISM="Thalassiosira punctigera, Strain Tpunct2005C2" /NCGR_SAMPLE_ID=MMETSP1067 /ASSEMBLY_ACC=CAM_ASM_000444 /LENGTH=51 /DNA_ID=CAMNT_0013323083 /DNA_START=77 /DNA_END=229 /DNA_ORIENTATION=+